MVDIITKLGDKMIADIFVVSWTKKQYASLLIQAQEFWNSELKNKQVHYVDSPEVLRGVHGARVFLYGSYFKRDDWNEIEGIIVKNKLRTLLIR